MDKARNIELEIRMVIAQIRLAVKSNHNYNEPGPRAAHIRKLFELRPLISQDKFYELTDEYLEEYVICFHNRVKADRYFISQYGEPDRDPNDVPRINHALERCRDILRFLYSDNPEFAHRLMLAYPLAWCEMADEWAHWTRLVE